MALDLTKLKIGDEVSEIENHTDRNYKPDCIHRVIFVRPYPHGRYMEIGLSGYTDEDRKTETFSQFELYHLPENTQQ